MRKKFIRQFFTVSAAMSLLLSTVTVSAAVTPSLEKWYDDDCEHAFLIVEDEEGTRVFDKESVSAATELSHSTLLVGDKDFFYYVDNGTISAFDLETGELVWVNYEFTGCCPEGCFAIDEDNTLYLCGYYGPNLFAVDKEGKTLINSDLDTDKFWPSEISLDENGNLDITFQSDGEVLTFDPNEYMGENKAESESVASGTTMKVVNCKEWISLRAYESTSAPVMRTIPLGAEVTFLFDVGCGFYKVEYEGFYGYVLSNYVSE